MRPAPIPGDDVTGSDERRLVADPLIHETDQLWKETAKKNREIFTEIFRPVPTNFVQNVDEYDRYLPKGKVGHVVEGMPLSRVKDRLRLGAPRSSPKVVVCTNMGGVKGKCERA